MKRLPLLWVLFVIMLVFIPATFTSAQTAGPTTPYPSMAPLVPAAKPASQENQWVSHQMNQPPPDTGDKYSFSPGLIDEIQDLYLQAKKEYEAKAAPRSQGTKDNGARNSNPVRGK